MIGSLESFVSHGRRERAFIVASAASLALLLAHVWSYRFLTDDAFISFRYARNLADGYGLVFNPGFERVEGYTNFLWVVILAAFDVIGIAPERIANVLSTLCGVAIWWAVFRYCRRRAADRPLWLAVLPLFLLAGTRSFAVWCTSGLETKLFEMLVVLGVMTAQGEIDAARAGGSERWTRSSLLLALACLTRPDGVLIAGCVLAVRFVLERRRGAAPLRAILPAAAIFAALVGGHLAFRRAYYGDWVPNTYYAKVGGDTWIEMGLRYLLTFAIEYGVVFWLPLLAASVVTLRREGRGHHGLLFAAVIVPHAASLVAIGGDHFEYRPLDLYFPFAYILIADGVAAFFAPARARHARRLAAAGLLAAAAVTIVTIPILTRLGFPDDYRAGFPGAQGRADGSRDLVSRSRFRALFSIPVAGAALDLYNAHIEKTTLHAVGIRQEEHALFLPIVVDEGQRLAELVTEGTIPKDAHIAIGSVGAIPYYSRLRTLDRQGLTDKIVARGEGRPKAKRLMAHNKLASFDDAIARGVDLWSPDGTHLIYKPSEQRLQSYARLAHDHGSVLVAARAGRNRVLLAEVPVDRAPVRLPRVEPATIFFARESQHPDAPAWIHMFLGDLLAVRGNVPGAIGAYEAAIARDSTNAVAMSHLGALFLQIGDAERALAPLTRAVALAPRVPKVRADLGRALAALGNYREMIQLLRDGLAVTPDDPDLAGMLARFLATCPDASVRNPDEALRIAEDLNRPGRPRTIFLLDTLAAAYASAGRFEEARRKALEAAAFAIATGDTTRAAEIRTRAEAYGEGKMPWSVPRI